MFCNHCGKTIKPDATACPHCGVALGESRFEGSGYTSVQYRVAPGEETRSEERYAPYTRTTYMSEGAAGESDVYARTTYRPVLPKERPVEVDDVEDEAEEVAQVADVDDQAAPPEDLADAPPPQEDEDLSGDEAEDFAPTRAAGISPEVAEHMKRLQTQKKKKGTRSFLQMVGIQRSEEEEEPEREGAQDPEPSSGLERGRIIEPIDEEEEEQDAPRRKSGVSRIVGMVAGACAIVALLIGGFILISYISTPRANIPGVSFELYTQGKRIINANASDEYSSAIRAMYVSQNTDGVTQRYAEDRAAIEALRPETPLENDSLFIDALLSIQGVIESANMAEGLQALSASDAGAWGEYSAEYRSAVANALLRLEEATDVRQLQGILATVTEANTGVPEATPIPAPTTSPYKTLSRGDKNSTAVQKMQERLFELGFHYGERDGDFGTVTLTAVKRFQDAVGMESTGIATPEFQQALYAQDAPRATSQDANNGATDPVTDPTTGEDPQSGQDGGDTPVEPDIPLEPIG